MSYAPIFRGIFPIDAHARWSKIRQFLSRWCLSGDARLPDFSRANSGLVELAREMYGESLSHSVQQWLALADYAAKTGKPFVRDCPVLESLEKSFPEESLVDATVILITGEEDLFFAIPNSKLRDDDPLVEVYQKSDPLSPAHYGQINSVSEFALKYFCLINQYAVDNHEWFAADGTDLEIESAMAWFDHALFFDSPDVVMCNNFGLLESADVVAIRSGTRLDVSIFRDPRTLDLPEFLQRNLTGHLDLRRQFTKRYLD